MDDEELYQRVDEVINNDIKRYIEMDGGRINLKRVEAGIIYVELAGACAGCPGAAITLRYGVEHVLKSKINEVKSVELVN